MSCSLCSRCATGANIESAAAHLTGSAPLSLGPRSHLDLELVALQRIVGGAHLHAAPDRVNTLLEQIGDVMVLPAAWSRSSTLSTRL